MINKILYVLIFSLLFACAKDVKINNYKIIKDFTDTISNYDLSKPDVDGVIRLSIIHYNNKDSTVYNTYSICIGFKDADTINLYFMLYSVYAKLQVFQGHFTTLIKTDKKPLDEVIDGKNYTDDYVNISSQALVLQRAKYNVGDTIIGFIDLKSMPFIYVNESTKSRFYGPFKIILQAKNSIKLSSFLGGEFF